MTKTASKKQMLHFFLAIASLHLAASYVHPVTPSFIVERGLDSSMFGVALAAMQTTYFLLSPFWGKLNQYISTRWMMLVCCTGYAVGQCIFLASYSEVGVVLGRAFSGMFTGGIFTAVLNYIINVSDVKDRGRNLTIAGTLQVVGSAGGYFIGGMIGVISTEAAFIFQIVMLVVTGIWMFAVAIPDAQGSIHDMKLGRLAREANPLSAFRAGRQFMNPAFALIFAVVVLSAIGMNAVEQCFNFYIRDQFGLSSAYNGAIKAVIAVVGLLANSTICMWLVTKTDFHRTFLPVLLLCGVSALAIVFPAGIAVFFVIAVVYFAMNTVRVPVIQNLSASRAKKQDSALVMGFYNSMNSLGGIFGALFAGLMYQAWPKLPFVFGGCAYLLAAVFGVLYIRSCKKYPLPRQE